MLECDPKTNKVIEKIRIYTQIRGAHLAQVTLMRFIKVRVVMKKHLCIFFR